jgi:hypothetical protein
MAESRFGQPVRTDCVVLNSSDGIALEQGNVLEGRRVIDDPGLKASENLVEQSNIIHTSKDRLAAHMAEGRFDVLLDLEKVVFRRIHQDDAAGTTRRTSSGERLD